jgi:hypothetical protein
MDEGLTKGYVTSVFTASRTAELAKHSSPIGRYEILGPSRVHITLGPRSALPPLTRFIVRDNQGARSGKGFQGKIAK